MSADRTLELMDNPWAGYRWVFVVLVIIPVGICRAMRAPWREIALAYAVIIVISAAFGMTSGEESWEMRLTVAAIGFMIVCVPGVPVVVLVTRLMGRWGGKK